MRRAREGQLRPVRLPDGSLVTPVGLVDLPVAVQLMLRLEDGNVVHWERAFILRDVWVVPLGESSPRDLYVRYADWRWNRASEAPDSPLGSLAQLVMSGAEVLDTPRAPPPGTAATRVVIQRTETVAAMAAEPLTEEEKRAKILDRIPVKLRNHAHTRILVAELVKRWKVFGPLDPSECTEIVDFELIGEPQPVSFRVPVSRKANSAAAAEGLEDWLARGIIERVAWSEPSYGFVFLVPKANGKWRITINPSGVNPATRKIDPDGQYMPASMVQEAMTVGHQRIACTLDLADAFLTLKLGETARRLSTFTSPIGKLRWNNGWFGWHSFPRLFQRVIMEKVVLPTLDVFPSATILAWIDDIVVGAKDFFTLLGSLTQLIDHILAIGGRLSLAKCQFLVTMFDWCGIEVDLDTSQWRIARERVLSLRGTATPTDRDALRHVLGILRYYYFGVRDHKAQRQRLALLADLDVPGTRLKKVWTPAHTAAMNEAIEAIVDGEWILVYDPTQRVIVSTDASGNHGFSVVANQYDKRTGAMRPISFHSQGWKDTQLTNWGPQVKEQYARRIAVCQIMPAFFPFADATLLCDNKNLATSADSVDGRVVRWQQDIDASGCEQYWLSGERNNAADYGSRTVVARPDLQLTREEEFERHIYAITVEASAPTVVDAPSVFVAPKGDETPVPGHLLMASMVAKIVAAQETAPKEERETWTGKGFSTATLGGRTFALHNNRLIVPKGATDIKTQLLRMGHDDDAHYRGGERTFIILSRRVFWEGMRADCDTHVKSCFKCEFAKPRSHKPSSVGELNPTIPPGVHHTWYADIKGKMPNDTGAILAVTEGVTRFTKLRYIRNLTAAEVNEELEETIVGFATRPVVLRTDGGPPFDSKEYKDFCEQEGINPVKGVPYHSQGQGLIETRLKGIAGSIMASLGGKAQYEWYIGRFLARLELIINSTYVESIGGSPSWAMYGREPRTRLDAVTGWNDDDFSERVLGVPGFEPNDLQEIIAAHHAQINAVQGRVSLASSLAQALTKRTYDASHIRSDFKVGDWVLVYRAAPNRLTPYFTGPYQVASLQDNAFAKARHFLEPGDSVEGPFSVSRLIHFDMSRATKTEIAQWQLEPGSALVEKVLEHRQLGDGSHEFHIRWLGVDVTSWVPSSGVRKVIRVIDYCVAKGIPAPGTEPKTKKAPAGRGRGRGRGKGRGGK